MSATSPSNLFRLCYYTSVAMVTTRFDFPVYPQFPWFESQNERHEVIHACPNVVQPDWPIPIIEGGKKLN